MRWVPQVAFRLGREIFDFFFHSGSESLVVVFLELLMLKAYWVLTFRKVSEEKCKLRQIKESLLSCSTILVHRFAYDRKVNGIALKVDVILMVSVAEYHHLKHIQIPLAQFRVNLIKSIYQAWQVLLWEQSHNFKDALIIFEVLAAIEVGSENSFEVKCHRPEAGSFEVKVKLHVLLRACSSRLTRFLQSRQLRFSLQFLFRFEFLNWSFGYCFSNPWHLNRRTEDLFGFDHSFWQCSYRRTFNRRLRYFATAVTSFFIGVVCRLRSLFFVHNFTQVSGFLFSVLGDVCVSV